MTSQVFLDVDTDTVAQSGHATATTAGSWDSWGDRSRTVFRKAAADVYSTKVTVAIEEYAGVVASTANQVGQQVSNLGVAASSSATVIDNADLDSVELLREHSSVLARPVNSERVVA